ncbi:MAG: pilus assembly protein TadG-related protein [Jatrophihabitans sp.]|uniref:pilus assembly protein TadG-related protein n=1 Tax=Jatrophihabitans sp. TaxID=1932789 RepID=UPI003F822F3E
MRRDDRGSILPLVPGVILGLLLLGGLVVDGSRDLQARGSAQAYAEEAARAGASAIVPSSTVLQLNFQLAQQRVDDYCRRAVGGNSSVHVVSCRLTGFSDATTCGDATARIVVNTQVVLQIEPTLLGMVGVTKLSATGVAHARPFEGLTAADAC